MGLLSSNQSTTSGPESRDTGFPEPFCGNRNTTLPHPEANLSPDACISADDIAVSRVMHRSRRSLLSKNNKRTVSHGVITPEMEQMYSDAVVIASDDMDSDLPAADRLDGGESIGRSSESAQGDGDENGHPASVSSGSRRRRLFGRLRSSK